MRPWFTLIVVCILAVSLLICLFIVDFVLMNKAMFEQPFTISISFPFLPWSHTWEGVQFMYIIAISALLGAALIAFTTLVLDTKRVLKVRSMSKELKRLQQALQEAQSLHEATVQEEQEIIAPVEEPSAEENAPTLASPEEINKSFEDAIEKDDFLDAAKKRREEEGMKDEPDDNPTDIRERVTGVSQVQTPEPSADVDADVPTEEEPAPEREEETAEEELLEDAAPVEEKDTSEEPVVEAELVEEEKTEEDEQEQQPDERNV